MNKIENSVILPVYNNERFLEETLNNLLEIIPPRTELIIVDDGSTDSSYRILSNYAKEDERIRLYRHAENLGAARSLKDGFAHSQGYYLYCVAADDFSTERRFEVCREIFERNPDVGMIVSNAAIMNESSVRTGQVYNIDSYITNHNIAINQFKRNYCLGATMTLRKDIDLLKKEGFLEEVDDYHISIEYLLAGYNIHIVREELIDYRIHSNNLSSRYSSHHTKVKNMARTYHIETIESCLTERNYERKEVSVALGVFELFRGNQAEALGRLEKYCNQVSPDWRVNFDNYFYLAVALYLQHKWIESHHYLQEAYRLDPNEPSVVNNMGVYALLLEQDEHKACCYFNTSLSIEPNYLDARNNLNIIQGLVRGRFKFTERILDKSLINRPNYEIS